MISMARATKPGWCCCCRLHDRLACGGRPQSKTCSTRCVRCRCVSWWCGSQSCRRIGRHPAGWFNPEFQTHGLSSIGTMTISSPRLCAASFPQSLAAVGATACYGTWLYSMGSKRNGITPRPFSQMAPSWMQRLPSKRGLLCSRIAAQIKNKPHPARGRNSMLTDKSSSAERGAHWILSSSPRLLHSRTVESRHGMRALTTRTLYQPAYHN